MSDSGMTRRAGSCGEGGLRPLRRLLPAGPRPVRGEAATITDSPSAQRRFIFPAMPRLDLTDEVRDELLQP